MSRPNSKGLEPLKKSFIGSSILKPPDLQEFLLSPNEQSIEKPDSQLSNGIRGVFMREHISREELVRETEKKQRMREILKFSPRNN